MSEDQEPKVDDVAFKRIGALWINNKGTVSIATGSIEIQGRKVKLTILPNKRKLSDPNANQRWPDWNINAEVPYDMDLGYRKKEE